MKESELLKLAAAKRYKSLLDKRAEAAINANNWNLPTVTVRASRRHVAAFTLEMASLAEDDSLAERYFVYGSEAITSIKNLAPLEGNFPAEQLDEWRTTYAAQVNEALEFLQEFRPKSSEAAQLLSAASELGLIEPVNESASSNSRLLADIAATALKTAAEIKTDETPHSANVDPAVQQSLDGTGDIISEDEVITEDPSTLDQSQTAEKPLWVLEQEPLVVRPRTPFLSRTLQGGGEKQEPVPTRRNKDSSSSTRRRGGEKRSSPFRTLESRFSQADLKKIDLIRQAAEAMAASYFESNLGTDPERSHRSTQIRAVFPKFTPGLIYGVSPKLNRRGANQEKNFKLSEVILILLYSSRITQNIIQTKKYRSIIPEVIDQAIAKALESKQELDNIKK